MEERGRIHEDPALHRYLHQVMGNLLPDRLQTDPRVSFSVFILKDPCLDAFSLPDGGVYVTTGLLARLENEAQLAMVIAHELAHCLQGHALQHAHAPRREKRTPSWIGRISGQRTPNGPAQDLVFPARDFEAEADRVGMSLVKEAGYDLTEARRLLLLLQQEAKELQQARDGRLAGIHSELQERLRLLNTVIEGEELARSAPLRKSEVYLKAVEGLLLENASLDLDAGRLRSAESSLEKYLSLRPDDARAQCLLSEIARRRNEEGGGFRPEPCDAQPLPPQIATIEIPSEWSRVKGGRPLLITREGAFRQYVLVQEIHVDRSFHHTDRTLKRGMLPQAAAEVIVDEIASDRAVLDFRLIENRPDVIDDHDGFRLVFTYRTREGHRFRTLYYGFMKKDWFYSIRFNAIDPDLFLRDLAAFEKMKESLRLVEARDLSWRESAKERSPMSMRDPTAPVPGPPIRRTACRAAPLP
jgi:hypothetical protein